MNYQVELLLWCILAVIAAGALVLIKWRAGDYNVGLAILFVVDLYIIHFPGALINSLPWYGYADVYTTLKGFRLTMVAVASFIAANLVTSYLFGKTSYYRNQVEKRIPPPDLKDLKSNGYIYFTLGVFSMAAFYVGIGNIPTVSAFVSSGMALTLIGLCLLSWYALLSGRKKMLVYVFFMSMILPLVTIIKAGHIFFGLHWALPVLVFMMRFVRPKRKLILPIMIFLYVGLCFYQMYMRDRSELRYQVAQGTVAEKAEVVFDMITHPVFFDPFDTLQLDTIESRLNQNLLVGATVNNMETGGMFAHGETFEETFTALVPRIIWPDKPFRLGGNELASKYTGIRFVDWVSVGIGFVMETYINFGVPGTVIGFMIFGIIIAIADILAAIRLREGDWRGFAIWYLPAYALINAHAALSELVSSAVAGLGMVIVISRYAKKFYRAGLVIGGLVVILIMYYFIYMPLVGPLQWLINPVIALLVLAALVIMLFPSLKRRAGSRN